VKPKDDVSDQGSQGSKDAKIAPESMVENLEHKENNV
jgi:hypothetical protein